MNTQEILNIVLLVLTLFFILISIAAVIIFVQVLTSLKRILAKTENFLDNIKINQEAIKIKILDYTEYVLLKIRKLIDDKLYPKKGGGKNARKKKA
jgi:predicted PurR-regulated permease PerM